MTQRFINKRNPFVRNNDMLLQRSACTIFPFFHMKFLIFNVIKCTHVEKMTNMTYCLTKQLSYKQMTFKYGRGRNFDYEFHLKVFYFLIFANSDNIFVISIKDPFMSETKVTVMMRMLN